MTKPGRLGWRVAPPVWLLGAAGRERVGDGVLHRLDRLAARRDFGGEGDGLLQLDVELLGRHGLLVGRHLDHGCVPLRLAERVSVATFEPLRFGRVSVAVLAGARVVLLLHPERRQVVRLVGLGPLAPEEVVPHDSVRLSYGMVTDWDNRCERLSDREAVRCVRLRCLCIRRVRMLQCLQRETSKPG